MPGPGPGVTDPKGSDVIRRRTLLTSALAATAAIGLAACTDDGTNGSDASDAGGASDGGGDGGDPLAGVTVSEDLGAEPTVEFTAPLEITAPGAKLVVEGDGAAIAEGDTIIWNDLYVDGATGKTLQSWWQGAPAGVPVTVSADEGRLALPDGTTVAGSGPVALWQVTRDERRTTAVLSAAAGGNTAGLLDWLTTDDHLARLDGNVAVWTGTGAPRTLSAGLTAPASPAASSPWPWVVGGSAAVAVVVGLIVAAAMTLRRRRRRV